MPSRNFKDSFEMGLMLSLFKANDKYSPQALEAAFQKAISIETSNDGTVIAAERKTSGCRSPWRLKTIMLHLLGTAR